MGSPSPTKNIDTAANTKTPVKIIRAKSRVCVKLVPIGSCDARTARHCRIAGCSTSTPHHPV